MTELNDEIDSEETTINFYSVELKNSKILFICKISTLQLFFQHELNKHNIRNKSISFQVFPRPVMSINKENTVRQNNFGNII